MVINHIAQIASPTRVWPPEFLECDGDKHMMWAFSAAPTSLGNDGHDDNEDNEDSDGNDGNVGWAIWDGPTWPGNVGWDGSGSILSCLLLYTCYIWTLHCNIRWVGCTVMLWCSALGLTADYCTVPKHQTISLNYCTVPKHQTTRVNSIYCAPGGKTQTFLKMQLGRKYNPTHSRVENIWL